VSFSAFICICFSADAAAAHRGITAVAVMWFFVAQFRLLVVKTANSLPLQLTFSLSRQIQLETLARPVAGS